MIARVQGSIVARTATSVVMDVQGVGYELRVSAQTARRTGSQKELMLWTHLHVSDNAYTLYGFCDRQEKEVFCLLISVTGLGPSTAMVILSVAEPAEVTKNILAENIHFLQGIKGVGKKTAQRIVLELKDKIQKGTQEDSIQGVPIALQEEALPALEALGLSRMEARKNLQRAVLSHADSISTLEDLIKFSLRQS